MFSVSNNFSKNQCFDFFPLKSTCNQNWPCRKIGQGQPETRIYDGPEFPTLHINRSTGSREEDFKVFTINGHGGHLGHVTWTIYTNFHTPIQRMLHMKFGFDWPSDFIGEDV